jgi:excisionase family DNA binding protein
MTPLCLRLDEVADRIGVSARTVSRLIASGDLPSITVLRRRLVPVDALEAYIAGRIARGR